MDPRPFKFLVKLAVRAFYPGPCPPKDYQGDKEEGSGAKMSKLDKLDTRGLAMILMDYMIDQEWVSEDQLLADLNLHHKLVRRALKFLQEKRDEEEDPNEVMEVQKQHTFSYWAVDLPRAFDMIQLRLHVMRQLLKDELEAKEEVGRYVCKAGHCNKQYDSFDIPDILQFDGSLQCVMCGGVVEQVFATGQTGDDEQRKQRRERCQRVQHEMEMQLEAMLKLVATLRHTQPPFLGSLHDWALNRARAAEAAKAEAEGRGADAQRSRGGGVTILAPPSAPNREHEAYRETHVQVNFADGSSEVQPLQPQPQRLPKTTPAKKGPGPAASAAAAAAGPAAAAAQPEEGAAGAEGAEQKPKAAQPFFLRGSALDAAPQATAQARVAASVAGSGPDLDDGLEWMDEPDGIQGAGESKEQIDAYTAHMLASLGGTQQGSVNAAEPAAAANEGWGLQGPGLQFKPEDWQPEADEERAGKRARLDDQGIWTGGPIGWAAPKKEEEDAVGATALSGQNVSADVKAEDDEAEWEDI
ncbi:hypothetical protein DUNSADRAFT_1524 [Dunaliella salina]|uniref:Transcription initiation factor IIE subunit alpha N-terminal domain-containing protein n=1 Tax=Dunaliella salina TaxID=3046 RepID=A0ABQ7GWZ2_DUNSA|nr:hypothetical protein DUNSADRAFT_1524 [Dunaliella salina]|eukprot:KAF5839126.1 hypothetical protein DUNSADRAFT_1524 [Dunaliella salina]